MTRGTAAWVWLLLWLLPALAVAQPTELAPQVVVLHSSELEWIEARRAVEAELTATGFEILSQESSAATPGELIDELRAVTRTNAKVRGSVAVFEESELVRAYVWIPEAETLFQVDVPPGSGRMAPEVLSLRIVELLRVRLLGQAPSIEATSPGKQPSRPRRAVWLVAGPVFSPPFDSLPVQVGLGAGIPLVEPLYVDASGFLGVRSGVVRTEEGNAELSISQVAVHGLYAFELHPRGDVLLGAGGGALFFRGRGEDSLQVRGREESGTLGYLSLRARGQLRWNDFAFVVLAEPGITLPTLSIRADDRELLDFGGTMLLVSAGLAWLGTDGP